MSNDRIVELLEKSREEKGFPAYAAAWGTYDKEPNVVWGGRFTYAADAPVVKRDSMFDLASLTKVIATTTVAMSLYEEGRFTLDQPVQSLYPGFVGAGKEAVTVRHLLLHNSGLPAYRSFHTFCDTPETTRSAVGIEPLKEKPETTTVYSCVGFITLQQVLERVGRAPLNDLFVDRVTAPLDLNLLRFAPGPEFRQGCVPTSRIEPWRREWAEKNGDPMAGTFIRGRVHDPAAFVMGGVSGNAGLFATIDQVARLARVMANLGDFEGMQVVQPETVREWTIRAGPTSTRALGWDTRSAEGSSSGQYFSDRSFGHTGYTGTSMWIDPERKAYAVLLTNRVHPDDSSNATVRVRPQFADLVATALGFGPR